jgi:hypothetical protein
MQSDIAGGTLLAADMLDAFLWIVKDKISWKNALDRATASGKGR